jgi:uncharacterized repeat protein (TIGR01451 family)
MENTMSKFTSLIRRAPKRFSALALIVAAAVIIPTAALAWGPNRETFTVANPSDHVQFDSITDNPNIGDERNFVGVRAVGSANTWYDSMNVTAGQSYIVRMYVHNDAATSLNLVAHNVVAKVNLPTTTGTSQDITGFITASNVGANTKGDAGSTQTVYDDATLTNSQNFNLAYVPGTLNYENNATGPNGVALPDSIFSNTGAQLGYSLPLNGDIPGCFNYAGYVTFEVTPQFPTPNFTVTKEVREAGSSTFGKTVTAKAGDTLNYRITYTNNGGTDETAVILKDTLPKGITNVPGTVKILNAANPSGAVVQNGDNLFTSGINIGNYTAGSNAILIFNATVGSADTLPLCGVNTLTNSASAQPYGLGAKSDTAAVTESKTCAPGTINVCQISTKTIVNINESDFDATKYTKDLSVCTPTVTPPVTPPLLPHTGMSENIVAVIGLGALIASITYYVASRRALRA